MFGLLPVGWLMGGLLANPTKKKIIQMLVLKSGPEGTCRLRCHHLLSKQGIKEGVCASADDVTNGVAAFQKNTKIRET